MTDEPLWGVHVYGPDDLHAMRDAAEAERVAAEMNAAWAKTGLGWPSLRAAAERWPYTPASHAADLAVRLADEKGYWS